MLDLKAFKPMLKQKYLKNRKKKAKKIAKRIKKTY